MKWAEAVWERRLGLPKTPASFLVEKWWKEKSSLEDKHLKEMIRKKGHREFTKHLTQNLAVNSQGRVSPPIPTRAVNFSLPLSVSEFQSVVFPKQPFLYPSQGRNAHSMVSVPLSYLLFQDVHSPRRLHSTKSLGVQFEVRR